jgi:hypothetical protein
MATKKAQRTSYQELFLTKGACAIGSRLPLFTSRREGPNLLKNSFGLLSDPCSGAEGAVFGVSSPILDHRSV